MSAEVLREAARLMRERAEAAVQPEDSPGWIIDHRDRYASPHEIYRGPTGAGDVGAAVDAETAEHIASWHPAVALAVADWLDFVAAGREAFDGLERARLRVVLNGTSTTTPPVAPKPSELFADTERHALAVTRSYLGESS